MDFLSDIGVIGWILIVIALIMIILCLPWYAKLLGQFFQRGKMKEINRQINRATKVAREAYKDVGKKEK